MEKTILKFKADNQKLTVEGGQEYAIHTVNYIEAHFDLGENWDSFDVVKAVWTNKVETKATILADGVCEVPWEVLDKRYPVRVNLVGSVVEDDELVARLTTEQIIAFTLDKNALIDGSETAPITPSQFEQFVANVKADADRSESAMRESESIKTEVEGLKSDVVQLKTDTEAIKTDVETIADGFDARVTEALDGISEAKTDALDGISSAKTDALIDIGTAKDQVVDDITEEGTRQVGLVTEEGQTQTEAVQNEGQTQVNAVRTEGGTQITNIEQKGADVLSRIPYFAPIITDTAEGSIASFTDGADDYPMKSVVAQIVPIQSGSGDPSPTNVRPISGWSGANVEQSGKNLLNVDAEHISKPSWYPSGQYNWNMGGLYGDNGYIAVRDNATGGAGGVWIDLKAGTYTISGVVELGKCTQVRLTLVNKGHSDTYYNLVPNAQGKISQTLTLPNDGSYVLRLMPHVWSSGVTRTMWFDKLQLELGSTPTAYEPYQGTTYSIPFKDSEDNPITVYGGEIDVVSGEGESDMSVPVDLGDLPWRRDSNSGTYYFYVNLPTPSAYAYNTTLAQLKVTALPYTYKGTGGWAYMPNKTFGFTRETLRIRDDSYTDADNFKASLTDVDFSYGVETPTPIYCEPTEIKTLKGSNNVWCDTGDISVEYPADTKLYIDKLIGTTTRTLKAVTTPAVVDTTESE